jgi:hypothetical protein
MDALGFDEVGLYRWEDESGSLHFGSGSQVPPRYRRRAVRVSTSVGVMPTDRAPASATPSQSGAPASGAPTAGTPAAGAPAAGTPAGERPPAKPEPQQPPPG